MSRQCTITVNPEKRKMKRWLWTSWHNFLPYQNPCYFFDFHRDMVISTSYGFLAKYLNVYSSQFSKAMLFAFTLLDTICVLPRIYNIVRDLQNSSHSIFVTDKYNKNPFCYCFWKTHKFIVPMTELKKSLFRFFLRHFFQVSSQKWNSFLSLFTQDILWDSAQ